MLMIMYMLYSNKNINMLQAFKNKYRTNTKLMFKTIIE